MDLHRRRQGRLPAQELVLQPLVQQEPTEQRLSFDLLRVLRQGFLEQFPRSRSFVQAQKGPDQSDAGERIVWKPIQSRVDGRRVFVGLLQQSQREQILDREFSELQQLGQMYRRLPTTTLCMSSVTINAWASTLSGDCSRHSRNSRSASTNRESDR